MRIQRYPSIAHFTKTGTFEECYFEQTLLKSTKLFVVPVVLNLFTLRVAAEIVTLNLTSQKIIEFLTSEIGVLSLATAISRIYSQLQFKGSASSSNCSYASMNISYTASWIYNASLVCTVIALWLSTGEAKQTDSRNNFQKGLSGKGAKIEGSFEKRKYEAYKQAAKLIKSSMNPAVDPCQDFFAYACGNYKQSASALEINIAKFYRKLGLEINKAKYRNRTNSFTAKVSRFYRNCKQYNARESLHKTDEEIANTLLNSYKDSVKKLKHKDVLRFRRAAKGKLPVNDIIKAYCARMTILLFPEVKHRFGAEFQISNSKKRNMIERKLQRMFRNIKRTMISMVRPTNANFTEKDDKTKLTSNVLRKLKAITLRIDWPLTTTDEQLDKKYKNVKIRKTDFFPKTIETLSNLGVTNNIEELEGTGFPKLNVVKDIIDIPWNLLYKPFFDRRWPIPLNYGALGQIIGHESAHALTDIMFEKRVNGSQITPIANLLKRISTCLVNEYSNFCPLRGSGLRLQCLNGGRTLIENIADNVGLLAAYSAYRQELTQSKDAQLPQELFGNISNDQLFFMGYAQMFCEPRQDSAYTLRQIQRDNHSPFKYRLLGSVKNCPMFYDAFKCPPQQRCFSNGSKK